MSTDDNRVTTISMDLPVPLTEEELRERLKQLSHYSMKLENLLEDRRIATGTFNTDIKATRGVIKELVQQTESGRQVQSVQVQVAKNFKTGEITNTRLDTKEIVDGPRSMTDEERQMDLTDGDGEEEPALKGKVRRGKPPATPPVAPDDDDSPFPVN